MNKLASRAADVLIILGMVVSTLLVLPGGYAIWQIGAHGIGVHDTEGEKIAFLLLFTLCVLIGAAGWIGFWIGLGLLLRRRA